MKKELFIFLSLLFIAFLSQAQECNESLVAQKPGIWKEGLKGSVTGIAASDLAREKAGVDIDTCHGKSQLFPNWGGGRFQ